MDLITRMYIDGVFSQESDFERINKPESIKKSIQSRLDFLGFDVFVDSVEVFAEEGSIDVEFSDTEGDSMFVSFYVDEQGTPIALILDDEDSDEDDPDSAYEVDLSASLPSLVTTEHGKFISFSEPNWLSDEVLRSIFLVTELDNDTEEVSYYEDRQGYLTQESIDERKISVIRGGKRVRLDVVKKKRRKRLTGKARASIRRAVRKRKAKRSRTARKLKRSLKIRKRQGLKTPKMSKRMKVAGTKDFKPGDRIR